MAYYYAQPPIPKPYGSTAPYAGTASPYTGGSPLPNFNQLPGAGGQPGAFTVTTDTSQPAAPGPAPAPAAPAAPSPPDLSHLDYSNDPILARIRALAEESVSQAQADATAARTRLVIGLGDPSLASQLGLGGSIGQQAKDNPFSTFAELSKQLNRRNVFDITGNLSDQHNLFYSSTRARQLALSGEQDLRDRASATNAAQNSLAQISAQITQAKMAAQAQEIQAEQDAYNRALQQALYGMGVSL